MQIRGKNIDVGAALYQALTGRSHRTAEKQSSQQKTREMVNRWGSTKAVAQKLGVSVRTVQRRLKGQQEAKNTRRAANKDAESRAHREAKVTPGRVAQFTGAAKAPSAGVSGQGGLYIYGLIKVSQDIRERGINPGSKIPAGQLDRVINALVQGGPDAAANELNSLISQYYVAGMSVERLDEIDY